MAKKVIEIQGLNFFYPDSTQALKNIALDIYEGESVGIIGPNGAGKSTLLLHLNGALGVRTLFKGETMELETEAQALFNGASPACRIQPRAMTM